MDFGKWFKPKQEAEMTPYVLYDANRQRFNISDGNAKELSKRMIRLADLRSIKKARPLTHLETIECMHLEAIEYGMKVAPTMMEKGVSGVDLKHDDALNMERMLLGVEATDGEDAEEGCNNGGGRGPPA